MVVLLGRERTHHTAAASKQAGETTTTAAATASTEHTWPRTHARTFPTYRHPRGLPNKTFIITYTARRRRRCSDIFMRTTLLLPPPPIYRHYSFNHLILHLCRR